MAKTKLPVSLESTKHEGRSSAPVSTTPESPTAITLSLEEANALTAAWWKMESLTRIISHAGDMFDGGRGVCDVWDHLEPIVKSIQPFIDKINERRIQAEAEASAGGVR